MKLEQEQLMFENKSHQEKHISYTLENNDNSRSYDNLLDVSTSLNDNILNDVMLSDTTMNYHEVEHLIDDCITGDFNTATNKIFDDQIDEVSILPFWWCTNFH